MVQYLNGELLAGPDGYAIVVSRFNELVTEKLLEGALDTLLRHGVAEDRITVARVPGAFEIPLAAGRLAQTGRFAAICCLGAVIQGETTHHEYINRQVAEGVMSISRSTGIPVTFGILTCQTAQQAFDRAGGKAGNKGREAALAAIEMVNVLRHIDQTKT
ncbi:MAG: 6,7-dimethyl-8-ribityllumazine synthase [Planctomycetaceae bacterium]